MHVRRQVSLASFVFQNGYDHCYYFVSTFMTYLRWHAARLKEAQGSISNSLRRAVVGCEQPVSHQIVGSAGPGFVGIAAKVDAHGRNEVSSMCVA
jgi:hypothetical protein